ncbi:MAG: DMT family transporter [Pseudomonadota bacterium]
MTQDRPLLGVFLMIGFAVIAPGMDALAKLAGEAIPVGQILAYRFGIQTLLLMPVALILGALAWPTRTEALWHVVRAALILAATGFFFTALQFMPIADAIAIFFVEPFILTLFGAVFLGEKIGWRRILACAIGFLGALLVIRPTFVEVGAVALLPLGTAVTFALYMIVNRLTARRQNPFALQAWTALAAAALILPLLWIFDGSAVRVFDPVPPEGRFWAYLIGVGIIASISHLFVTGALRFAPASTVAPLQYLEIIAATLLGYLIFSDLPDAQTILGVAIIVASGLFVIWRERLAKEQAV